jgi:hypothetical protein
MAGSVLSTSAIISPISGNEFFNNALKGFMAGFIDWHFAGDPSNLPASCY